MNEPTQEQIREFWEWCGFEQLPMGNKNYHFEATFKVMDWIDPDKGTTRPYLPRIDLNSLFEYAVPRLHKFGLLECGYNRELAMFGDTGELLEKELVSYRWRLLLESQILTPIDGYGNTPALALFWAIYQLALEP